jgi:hypothetical protein
MTYLFFLVEVRSIPVSPNAMAVDYMAGVRMFLGLEMYMFLRGDWQEVSFWISSFDLLQV